MSRPDAVRVLMYSHDTYGLGHLTRTVRIARALRSRYDQVSILILSGSPVAPYVALPPGADLVKLPSVVKAGKDRYRSRDLKVTFSQIKQIRRELIRGTAEAFRPHIFMVDNVPLGMKREVVPTLRFLRASSPSTRIVLNLRDILDDPVVIEEAWRRDGVPEILEECYDRILVLGDAGLFDAIDAYNLPRAKTSHVGYAAPRPRPSMPRPRGDHASSRVLITVGGGGDGFAFLEKTLDGLGPFTGTARRGAGQGRLRLEVVTGPLMDPKQQEALARKVDSAGIELQEFVDDLPQRMARADLVIAMAGYNTCCEIFSHAPAALVWPRITPRIEQLLRAEALEAKGIVSMLPPDVTDPRQIEQAVFRALDGEPIRSTDLPAISGLDCVARAIGQLCPILRTRATPTPARGGAGRTGRSASTATGRTTLGIAGATQWSHRYWTGGALPFGAVQT